MNKYSDLFRPSTTANSGTTFTHLRATTPVYALNPGPQVHTVGDTAYHFDFLTTTPSTRDQALSRENLSVGQKSQRLLKLENRSRQLTQGDSPVLPNSGDIARLLYNLDAVGPHRAPLSNRHALQENSLTQVSLMKDATQYFRISTKGRPVPLAVTINKRQGSVRCYLSKTVAEPSAVLADFIFKQSSFKITDSSETFRCPWIYLALHATGWFEGTLQIRFGSIQQSKSNSPLTKSSSELQKTPSKTLTKSASSTKNFIRLNLDPVPLNSTSRHAFHAKKAKEWVIRRKLAVEKRQETLQQKKERTIAWLSKQKLKRQREKQQREETLQLQLTQARQRQWLTLVQFVCALTTMKTNATAGRTTTLHRLRRSNSIRRIQTAYKKLSPAKHSIHISLMRANNLLVCYHKHCNELFAPAKERMVVAFTKDSFFHTALDKKLEHLTQCVMKIQTAWRLAMKKTREQLFLLGMMWNEVATKMCNDKKKKKQDKASQKILSISLQDKNDILGHYLISKKRKFQRIIQICMTEAMLKRAKFLSAFTGKSSKLLVRDALPNFEFVPTEEKMRKLISSALNAK